MKRITFTAALLLPMVLVAAFAPYRQLTNDRLQHSPAAQPVPYRLVEVAKGFTRPLFVTAAGDGSNRLFVVDQDGKIWIIADDTRLSTPFLDISGLVSQEALGSGYTERGLLGLAFDPAYSQNGRFFINYTDRSGNTVVARYTVSPDDPNLADPNSAVSLMYVQQPYANHNGGNMIFGPDGYLYISFGDGGSGGDPQGNAQNLSTLLGSLLRIDVSGDEGYTIPADNPFVGDSNARPEIWAWGLRNAWRFSFDRETGDLLLADVGQNNWEEIDFQPANSPGGQNYGWNAYEGTHVYSGRPAASDAVGPILEYSHSSGRCSVTGGYVYRGTQIPGLQGYYFYGDWCTGTIWVAHPNATGQWEATVSLESGRHISSFGEDEAGEMYVVDQDGTVLRIEPS